MNNIKISGIYRIRHRYNNKSYIGSSNNIYRRFWEHTEDLIQNKHCNKSLQSDFNLFDSDLKLFKFYIIKRINPNYPRFYLHAIERLYIERAKKRGEVYNVGTPSKKIGMTILTMKVILFKNRIRNFFITLFES